MKRDTKWTPAINGLACLLGLALGGVFFYTGLQKRLEPYQFAEAILAYDLLPLSLVGLVAAVLPWVELTSGFFLTLGYLLEILGRLLVWLGFPYGNKLVGGIKRRSCLLLILLQVVLILLVLCVTLARGLKIDCGCGLFWTRQVGWKIIVEDVLMAGLAVFLFWWDLPGEPEVRPEVKVRRAIDDFEGDYDFLSNFSPVPVMLDGVRYPTVEHAYQAAKTLEPGEREKIRHASTPGLAKKMGRRLEKRPDWADLKVDIMRDLVRQKFEEQPDLKKRLLATGETELVEGNTWHDNFWGECRCARCESSPGQNWLGRILMEVRSHIKEAG